MNLPGFFRTPQHKRFNFVPRYYNRQKEELEERIRLIEREEAGSDNENFQKSIIRGSFRHSSAYRAKENRSSSFRILAIIAILLLLVFLFFSI